MGKSIRLACVQTDVVYGDWALNQAQMVAHLENLAKQGVEIAVFPEAFLTGYCASSRTEAERIAMNPDATRECLEDVKRVCERLSISVVFGAIIQDVDGNLYNSAFLVESNGEVHRYDKVHLPHLGVDRFVTPGNQLPVFETQLGKIGVLICYDQRPPESARVMALKGAELIILPTNWPVGAEISANHVSIVRAAENRVFFVTCNRVGHEKGFDFIGKSKIIDPVGRVLASLEGDAGVILADIDLELSRVKHTVIIPGEYELSLFGVRQPDLYRHISEP